MDKEIDDLLRAVDVMVRSYDGGGSCKLPLSKIVDDLESTSARLRAARAARAAKKGPEPYTRSPILKHFDRKGDVLVCPEHGNDPAIERGEGRWPAETSRSERLLRARCDAGGPMNREDAIAELVRAAYGVACYGEFADPRISPEGSIRLTALSKALGNVRGTRPSAKVEPSEAEKMLLGAKDEFVVVLDRTHTTIESLRDRALRSVGRCPGHQRGETSQAVR